MASLVNTGRCHSRNFLYELAAIQHVTHWQDGLEVDNDWPIIDRHRAYSDALFSYGRFQDIIITASNEQLTYPSNLRQPFIDDMVGKLITLLSPKQIS